MARLILLNGPPASGKSTLAARFAEQHPLTLCLDIDVVRGLLGDWTSRPTEAGLLARRIAVEMARTALEDDRDVIVPQLIARGDFIAELDVVARETRSTFVHLALTATWDDVVAWFTARSVDPQAPTHADAALLIEQTGGTPALRQLFDRLNELVTSRPSTWLIPARSGDMETTYGELERILESLAATQ